MDKVRDLESKHVVQTYRRTPIVLVRGKGVRVYDAEGREYLDLLAGIGVGALGHGHEGLAQAIAEQSREMIHCSNLFFHPLQGQVAERLARLSGLSRAFFCNSGAEAVEACLKFARRYWHTKGSLDRTEIIAMEGDFHGRTMGALSTTWTEPYRKPFEPLLPNVRFVPVNAAALREAVTERTAAIILEPIQGEGGVRPLTQEFANVVAEVCKRTGTLLIADEVQCGLGRTGQPFYFQKLGMSPDLVPVGKALAGGVPMGAALVKEDVAAALAYGDHGTTFGGNLLACRAALVCLDQLSEGLMEHVKTVGSAPRSETAGDAEEVPGDYRRAGRRPHVGHRTEYGCCTGARGCDPARRAGESHGGNGDPLAATAHHHARGARPGDRVA